MTDTSRQGDRPRSRLHAMRRPYEDGVPKQDTKSGKRIAHGGLGHVHPLGCSRDVPLLNKHFKAGQSMRVDILSVRHLADLFFFTDRSEERRVGKERVSTCRCGWLR